MIGNFSHLFCSSVDFVSESHFVQLVFSILSEYISAYRRHHSCETSLLRLTEDWRRSLDNKEIVAVISMDLSKAFDTIPHALPLMQEHFL